MNSADTTLAGRKIFERHLDLLLAEELVCNADFARFVFSAAFRDRPGFVDAAPAASEVTVSDLDVTGIEVGASGENDLLVESRWNDGRRYRLLVEDKLDAVLQPSQVERYLERARRHADLDAVADAAAIVIAPDRYLTDKAAELSGIAGLSIEAIAEWLDAAADTASAELASRLRWRARHLIRFEDGRRLPSPDMPEMIDARDHLIARLAELAPGVRPGSGMRTASGGWLSFETPAPLTYKVVHGVVDIYLDQIWPDSPGAVDAHHRSDAGPKGFEPAVDSGGNRLMRAVVRVPSTGEGMRPIGDIDTAELERGARACALAARWIGEVGGRGSQEG